MKTKMLTRPTPVHVKRSELRDKQKAMLSRAKGSTVLVISGSDEGEEKLVLDKKYFDEVLRKLRAAVETMEIAIDKDLFNQIMSAAQTLDEDMRLGKLHSLDEAFN
jgi:hypothetical protein